MELNEKRCGLICSKAYAPILKERRGKLDHRAEVGILVGYAQGGKGCRVT